MKIVTIVGTRPEFVQCSSVSFELRKRFQHVLVHTGQHYDYEMNEIFSRELKISEPDCYLNVGSGSHGFQTGEMIKGIEAVLAQQKPDLVLVYGDTNSTLAGALAASKSGFKVCHIEAGLRSFDRTMPEEINRILVDHCADLFFCPTQTSVANLQREGITENAYLVGDVTAEAIYRNWDAVEKTAVLENLNLSDKQYVVITIHRANNTEDRENLINIVNALHDTEELFVFPVHPRTEIFLKKYGILNGLLNCNVKLVKPLGYLEFVKLLKRAKKVVTDSGGIQKEAYILKVPCITVRNSTEWVETVNEGWSVLVGTDSLKIREAIEGFEPKNKGADIFPPGASFRITNLIQELSEKGRLTRRGA